MALVRRFHAWVLPLWVACAPQNVESTLLAPPPERYDASPDFSGAWVGELAGIAGTLDVRGLGTGRYYGAFASDDRSSKYVLNMRQTFMQEGAVLSNRVLFEWQDGRGGHGHGWMLVNREDSALTGAFGFGVQSENAGALTFIRVE